MKISCPQHVDCPGTDFPISNLSSETTDGVRFFAEYWGSLQNMPPLTGAGSGSVIPNGGGGGGTGPGGGGNDGSGDPGDAPVMPPPAFCISEESQDAADSCAQIKQTEDNNWSNSPNSPHPTFLNQQVSCSATCPDGSVFNWTILAGQYAASSQVLANNIAHSAACHKAVQFQLCLSSLNANACMGQEYFDLIVLSRGMSGATFSLVDGSLPPGVVMVPITDAVEFQGTPTAGGVFNFIIRATDPFGNHVDKAYTITVRGVMDGTLPPATNGTAYSEQIPVAGDAPFVFVQTGGVLPDGLTMSGSGLVSGTPTADGAYQIQVSVTDASGHTCAATVDLFVEGVDCSVFENMVWDPPIYDNIGGASSGSATGASFTTAASCPGFTGPDGVRGRIFLNGQFSYTGPALNCCIQVTSGWGGDGTGYTIVISQEGFGTIWFNNDVNSGSFPFTVNKSLTPGIISIALHTQAGATFENPGAKSITMSAILGGCP